MLRQPGAPLTDLVALLQSLRDLPDTHSFDAIVRSLSVEEWVDILNSSTQWQTGPGQSTVYDMGVNHRAPHVITAQKFLNGSDIVAACQ